MYRQAAAEGAVERDDRRRIACWARPATIGSACCCDWRAQARKSKRWDEASAQLESAAAVARSDPERLQAQLLLRRRLARRGPARDAVEICERLLTDERLRPLAVAAADGHRTVRADLFIADRLNSIVRDPRPRRLRVVRPGGGPAVRAGQGRERRPPARRGLPGVSRGRDRARCALRARVAPRSVTALDRGRPRLQALLLIAPDDDHRALAIWRLAHVYEARKLFLSARDSYLDLAGAVSRASSSKRSGTHGTVAELVAAELARPPYAQLVADRPVPRRRSPWFAAGTGRPRTSQPIQVLSAVGVAPSLDAGRLFLVEKTGLRMLDPTERLSRLVVRARGRPPSGPATWPTS